MKIKHWQGYGNVEAKVVSKEKPYKGVDLSIVHIKVKGNHEYGLIRENDSYDIKRWLMDKLVREAKDLNPYKDIRYSVNVLPEEKPEPWMPQTETVECVEYVIAYGKQLREVM